MARQRRIELGNVIPLINKKALYTLSWGLNKRKKDTHEIQEKFDAIESYLTHFFLHAGITGIVYYDVFHVSVEGDTLHFLGHPISWTFPRINGRCIADSAKETGKIALQVVTLGKSITKLSDQLEREELYSMLYYFHGFSVWMAEALAEYHHSLLRRDWNTSHPMERYSFGYPLCPDIRMQEDLFNLLGLTGDDEVTLLPSGMMLPEQSTSAIILH